MTSSRKIPHPEISSLRAFLLTSHAGSTAAAARILNISQPAVSTSIRRLESLVGTPLFDRASRPMQLTAAGRMLKNRVSPLLEDLDNLANELQGMAYNHTELDVRIGFSDSFGMCVTPFLMPRVLPHLHNMAAYCQSTPAVVRRLLADEVDIAFATKYPSEDPKVNALMLSSENFLIVTPKAYEGKIQQISDLAVLPRNLPVIRFNDDSLDSIQIERVLRQCNFHGGRTLAIDTNRSAMSFVANNIGWTVMPPLGIWCAKEFIPSVALHRIDSLRATRSFYVMYKNPTYRDLTSLLYKESLSLLRSEILPEMQTASPLLASSFALSVL